MDLPFMQRQIRKVWLMKAAQIAGSEGVRNIIGAVAYQDPDPVLLVLPDENATKKIMRKRIIPLFEDTPCLAALKTDATRDQALHGVYLKNGFELGVGWSGSPTTLASDPIRIVVNDEVDKFSDWNGKESDPISLAEVRTATYENSLVYNVSTPTTPMGLIYVGWSNSPIKLWYFVPCPFCGHCQRLVFDRLQWGHKDEKDSKKRAALIERDHLAWYRCANDKCDAKIQDSHKPRMCSAGYWGTDDGAYKLYADGREVGTLPPGNEVGFQISTLYSMAAKHKFYLIAAEWCKCAGDPMRTQNFKNSWMGEVFEELVAKPKSGLVRELSRNAPPPLIIPAWATLVISTADTQKDHFYFTTRAWGYGLKSQLIHYGRVETFEALRAVTLNAQYSVEGGLMTSPRALLIDSGGGINTSNESRTQEVYQFALTDMARIMACKGASHQMMKPWEMSRLGNVGLMLRRFDTNFYKSTLHRLMTTEIDAEGGGKAFMWLPHNSVSDDYCQQMTSEQQVIDRKKNKLVWKEVSEGAANHYWDCEVLQCLGADMANVGVATQQTIATAMKPVATQPVRNEISRPSWMPDRPEGWTAR